MLRNVNPWVMRIILLLIGGNQWVYNGMTWLVVISHGWLRHMGMGQHLSFWCRGWNTLVTLVFTICSSWLLITTLFKTWAAKTIFLSINHLIIGGPQFTGQYECMLKFLFGVGNARVSMFFSENYVDCQWLSCFEHQGGLQCGAANIESQLRWFRICRRRHDCTTSPAGHGSKLGTPLDGEYMWIR